MIGSLLLVQSVSGHQSHSGLGGRNCARGQEDLSSLIAGPLGTWLGWWGVPWLGDGVAGGLCSWAWFIFSRHVYAMYPAK